MGELPRLNNVIGVPVGHPHVDGNDLEQILNEGYRFLMPAPVRSYAALGMGRKLAGRE